MTRNSAVSCWVCAEYINNNFVTNKVKLFFYNYKNPVKFGHGHFGQIRFQMKKKF